MKVFTSQLEKVMLAKELRFDATPGFGVYKRFLSHSIAHPAKMNTRLLEFLIDEFTVEGETVLDPMSGSGSTGVVAALHGRHTVCVELEQKFYLWMEQARKEVESQQTLTPKGKIKNVLGDARQLSQILKEADIVVTSPPYAEMEKRDRSKESWFNEEKEKKFAGGSVAIEKGYQAGEGNIGNLRHGEISAIITSPPYGEAQDGHGIAKKGYQGKKHSPTDLVGNRSYMPNKFENERNISTLPYGVDVIVTSPPYAESQSFQDIEFMKNIQGEQSEKIRKGEIKGHFKTETAGIREFEKIQKGKIEHPENIGSLRFDVAITSTPYERTACAERHWGRQEKYEKMRIIREKKLDISLGYSRSKKNIGNIERETYLEAMLQVYTEMYKVLKPQGKAIIIIKPFIRNKKVVDLPYHTWLLLKRAGFTLTNLLKLRLKQQSFWRILYQKKYPKVQQIKHEYILICGK